MNRQLSLLSTRSLQQIRSRQVVFGGQTRLFAASSRGRSSSSPTTKIGFIGLGNMGLPMCLNLLSSKQELEIIAYDLNDESLAKAQAAGAVAAGSIEHVGHSDCKVIFTMLPGCNAVNHVMQNLVLFDSHKNDIHSGKKICYVDCSTVSPTTSRRWHLQVESMGHAMLDAPVSGGVRGAQDGTLTFMVGCQNKKAMELTRPLLQQMGTKIIPCGGPTAGATTKLCNNLALATQMIGICEAMNLSDALGVEPVVLADVMNMSTAKCWSSEVNNPHPDVAMAAARQKAAAAEDGAPVVGPPASRNYEGGFGTKLMLKDLGLAVGAGQDAGVALPLGSASRELYRMAEKRGLGDKDFGVMLQFLRGK